MTLVPRTLLPYAPKVERLGPFISFRERPRRIGITKELGDLYLRFVVRDCLWRIHLSSAWYLSFLKAFLGFPILFFAISIFLSLRIQFEMANALPSSEIDLSSYQVPF